MSSIATRTTPPIGNNVQSASVTMTTANTEYSFPVPAGCIGYLLRLLAPAETWNVSSVTGQVATATGTPMAAGEAYVNNNGPFKAHTIYFASATAAMTMRVEYTYG